MFKSVLEVKKIAGRRTDPVLALLSELRTRQIASLTVMMIEAACTHDSHSQSSLTALSSSKLGEFRCQNSPEP